MWFTGEADAFEALKDEIGEDVARSASKGLRPTLRITTFPGKGLTQIGGRPHLAAGAAWPVRGPAVNVSSMAIRAGKTQPQAVPGILRVASKTRPLTFLAQADLSEAPSEAAALGLPDHGLLQFFLDLELAPWESSRESGRVVWTPEPASATAATPASVVASTAARGSLRRALAPPIPNTIEGSAALRQHISGEDKGMGAYRFALHDRETGSWTRVGGPPDPLGNDPRIEVAAIALLGTATPNATQWEANRGRVIEAARDYAMIGQVELSTCLPEQGHDGVAFFVIKAKDLAKRTFSEAIAVYQRG